MKIAIFGASGKTGILTVYQSLDKGHQVTAFSRNPSAVTIQHKKLKIVQGDILDYEKVKEAVEGQEVVICALGVESRKHSTVLSEGTGNIVRAMEECKVNRLICMSSAGVLVNDLGILYGKTIIPIFLKQVFLDKIRQINIIRETTLDWVIIRPSSLTDAPKTGKYKITKGPPATGKIPRADVADFMLKLITNKQYDHQMPAISS